MKSFPRILIVLFALLVSWQLVWAQQYGNGGGSGGKGGQRQKQNKQAQNSNPQQNPQSNPQQNSPPNTLPSSATNSLSALPKFKDLATNTEFYFAVDTNRAYQWTKVSNTAAKNAKTGSVVPIAGSTPVQR